MPSELAHLDQGVNIAADHVMPFAADYLRDVVECAGKGIEECTEANNVCSEQCTAILLRFRYWDAIVLSAWVTVHRSQVNADRVEQW